MFTTSKLGAHTRQNVTQCFWEDEPLIRSRRPHYHRNLVAAVDIHPDADLKYALRVRLCLYSRYGRNVKKNKKKHEKPFSSLHLVCLFWATVETWWCNMADFNDSMIMFWSLFTINNESYTLYILKIEFKLYIIQHIKYLIWQSCILSHSLWVSLFKESTSLCLNCLSSTKSHYIKYNISKGYCYFLSFTFFNFEEF